MISTNITVPKMAGKIPPSVFDSAGVIDQELPEVGEIVGALLDEAHGVRKGRPGDQGQREILLLVSGRSHDHAGGLALSGARSALPACS